MFKYAAMEVFTNKVIRGDTPFEPSVASSEFFRA